MVEAADRYAVYDVARSNGHTVSEVLAVQKFSLNRLIDVEKINYHLSRVKTDELVIMTRNLGSMLRAGLPLSRALSVIERQSKNPRMQGTIVSIRAQINKGDQLHEALARFPKIFSSLYISMVRAGEEGGTLAESLTTIGVQLERSSNLQKKIKGAMMYPTIILSVMLLIGILMMIYVMPTLISTFEKLGTDLPTMTKVMIGTSKFLTQNGLLSLSVAIVSIASIVGLFRTTRGRRVWHWILIHLPIIGNLVKETNAARTGRTLSSLLTSGVDVINAISITEDVLQNVYYKAILKEAAVRVEKGSPLSEVFIAHEKLYPVLVGEMILVGEETGQISQMLTEIADFYENEVEQKTKDLSTIIEPILMVVIGAGVGFFALAMIAPIYSLSDSIG
ncbi:MAG: type II secretion system F family protein [Candidatus Pacebacteria bacterium]|nr:type II secretion system F family protein [Candidatus Paceibacterota bacterium]